MRDTDIAPTLRWLRFLGLLSVVVPLLAYAGWGVWRLSEVQREATQRVSRSLRVAHEHALKVLGNAESTQDRIFDLVDGKPRARIAQQEPSLYELLHGRDAEADEVQSIWIIGADGRPIVSSLSSPPPPLDLSDRAYFKFHSSGQHGARYLSEPFVSRSTRGRVIDLSRRFDGEGAAFGGTVNVSLNTDYFRDFYADLVADEPGLAVTLFERSGSIVTRWPPVPDAPPNMSAQSPTLQRVAGGAREGTVRGVSSVDGRDRLVSFQQVGPYGLYVGTGMDMSTVRAGLLRDLALLLLLGAPPFAALFIASVVAARRARESFQAATRLAEESRARVLAEEALLQAQKLEALGRLVGGVAHDFNNALMIVGNNVLLLRAIADPAGAKRLDSIERAVESATRLTRQLLSFSRRQPLQPATLDLQFALPAASELLDPALGSGVSLELEVEPGLPPVELDRAEFELALLNLAINARDAMPRGGRFTLAARLTREHPLGPAVSLAVAIDAIDTGEGMDAETAAKAFEPFFTTKGLGRGTGLGLSQVYGFCARAEGAVVIHSRLGEGTRVSMFFPPRGPVSPDRA